MLGSSAILADDGGGGAAVAAAAAAARAGRVEAGLPRGAAAELRLHGLIERSVSLVVLVFLHLFVLSASAFHLGALPSVKARAACALFLSCSARASIFFVVLISQLAFMR